MTPHKIAQEVTGEELQNRYMIQSTGPRVKSWVKEFFLNTGSVRKNGEFNGRLYWNDDDGYSIVWDTDAPPEADRPEFEYILDSLTRQDYY